MRYLSSGGYTLIELIVVLVVIGILSAAVVPVLSTSNTEMHSQAAASRLLHDLYRARQCAMVRGIRVWLTFDVDQHSYAMYIENEVNPGRVNRNPFLDPVTSKAYSVSFSNGMYAGAEFVNVDIDQSNEVGFDYLGRPLGITEQALVSDGTISMSDSIEITITARTGHIYRNAQ